MVFVVSTTGQGDLPSNAKSFWKSLLRKKLPYDCLSDVSFTSFGLGDRSYPRFNWAARKLHKRITQLGAAEIFSRGEADEQHEEGLDAFFIPWSVGLKDILLRRFPLEPGVSPLPEYTLLEPKWLLHLGTDPKAVNGSTVDTLNENENKRVGANNSTALSDGIQITRTIPADVSENRRLRVTLQENRRVTPKDHWQDVRHLAFAAETPAPYGPGDVLTIYPQNSIEAVNEIIFMMNWTDVADELIEFVPTRQKSERYPPPPFAVYDNDRMTLRYLLTHHLDITAIPRRSFFSLIAHFTTDQFQKDRLLEFTDPKYVDELYDYTTRPRRSLIEVLQEFESVKVPWQWAACVLPELRGRQFSIASGGHLKANADGTARFELLVAVVKYKTVIKKVREGVCTKYLAGLEPGSRLAVSLQRGGLGLSELDLQVPIIMIGPGTGVAPIRSLILERQLWRENQGSQDSTEQEGTKGGTITAGSLLFFGGRNRNADYFYEDEWEVLQKTGTLQVLAAFSRDQASKYYVQDALRENSQKLANMLCSQDAIVYVCGSSGKMPTAVRAALVDVIRENRNASKDRHDSMIQEAALQYLEKLERAGRYKQETW